MSTQRGRFDGDSRLSDAYRELQDERAPTHLDEEILKRAAREARTRYGALRAWTRPAAWAAMIGLCLTLVLELTRVDNNAAVPLTESILQDQPPAAPVPQSMPASAPASLDAASGENALLKRRRVSGKAETGFATLPVTAEQSQPAAMPEESLGDSGCDATARETPESWHDCIRRLWDAGQDDAAQRELEALRETFPNFSLPARHK